MPVFWIVVGIVGIAFWWKLAHRFPSINLNEDALTLLNFPPYTLQSGKDTYSYFLSPQGLTARDVTGVTGGSASSVRRGIPLPGPTTLPAFAELWAVQTHYTGANTTVTPMSVLQENGTLPAVASVEPARQLAAKLYAAALSPLPGAKLILIPIAAKQA